MLALFAKRCRLYSRVPDDACHSGRSAGHVLIAVFFSSVNAWYWFVGIAVCAIVWYFLVRMRKSAMACRGLFWLEIDVRSWCASYFGWRACWITPAHERFGENPTRRTLCGQAAAVFRVAGSADFRLVRHWCAF